jgi:hypothetical protein
MRPWLERLAFSFLIIAVVLAWEGYKRSVGRVPIEGPWRITLYYTGAVASAILGFIGTALRHRPRNDPPPDNHDRPS